MRLERQASIESSGFAFGTGNGAPGVLRPDRAPFMKAGGDFDGAAWLAPGSPGALRAPPARRNCGGDSEVAAAHLCGGAFLDEDVGLARVRVIIFLLLLLSLDTSSDHQVIRYEKACCVMIFAGVHALVD